MSSVKTLVLDIETIVDEDLVQAVRGQTLAEYREELGGENPWIPATYHRPVAIGIAKLDAELRILELACIEQDEPEMLAGAFWDGWRAYGGPLIVTWNGRRFDLPVLEAEAFRRGVAIPEWFKVGAKSWEDPRNRYCVRWHLDLQDEVGNRGSGRLDGGLNLVSRLSGAPGKIDTSGGDVAEMHAAGQLEEIRGYCLTDVLNTWSALIRWMTLVGAPFEQAARESSVEAIEAAAERYPAVRRWLA